MPFLQAADIRTYYRLDGADGRSVVILSHSLGVDHGLWDALVRDLIPHFSVLRYDTRGHGASETAGSGTIEQFARDVLALADALGIQTFAFCGLSLGGMVGQWLGMHAADRVTRLVLANTTPRVADPSVMEDRRRRVLDGGMPAVIDIAMQRSFSPASLDANGPAVAWARRTMLATRPEGYAAACAAIRDMDFTAALGTIRVPTLVLAGDSDQSMPWDGHSRVLAESIPGATAIRLDAAHLSILERPRSFTAAVLEFLLPKSQDVASAGMAVRRGVLGDAHVDRAIAGTTDLTRDFQDLITRYAWGTIWTRPGLDRRTRRLLVLATTASMGRWEEFRLHLRSGLAADLELVDLKEALLQVAVYAGIPAANTAFHIASEELAKK
jgi:3-oxoadipate enol-lactonase/4-carboxymuconolactone decarboxylase